MNTIQDRLNKELENLEKQLEAQQPTSPQAVEEVAPLSPEDNPLLNPNTASEGLNNPTDESVETPVSVEELQTQLQKSEHRYSVLQGKFNKEVKSQNDVYEKTISQLQQELAEAKAKQTSASLGEDFDFGVPQEVLETLDPEYRELLKNSMQANLAKAMQPIQEEIEAIKADKTKASVEQTAAVFERELESRVPGWTKEVNSADFNDWLESTGRMKAMQLHWNYPEEVQAVADIIQIYRSSQPAAPQSHELPAGAVLPANAQPSAETSVHRSVDTNIKPVYTRAQVDQFYSQAILQLRAGKMTQQEFNERDAEITQASLEGRIR